MELLPSFSLSPMTRLLSVVALGAALLTGCANTNTPAGESTTTGAGSPVGFGTPTGTSASAGVMVGGAMMLPTQTLVQNAAGASNLTTLVAAVQAAGLAETLSGPGPFTVFAPPNSAFDALPDGTVESLLMAENRGQLTGILTYHVVPGRLSASDLRDGQMLTTVNGEQLRVTKRGDMVMVGDAHITQANVYASNGVAHVIDKVLMPGM